MTLYNHFGHFVYEHKGFLVTIRRDFNHGTYEAWLQHRDFGISMHMFTVSANTFSSVDVKEFILDVLDDYIAMYELEYMGV